MNTTVYLIRHSTKFDPNNIGTYNSKDDKQLKTEKKMLSVEGEKRAEILSKQEEFKSIDVVYCSNYVRAMQTAKYFIKTKNLKLNIDERFNERKFGTYDKEEYPNFFCDQYWNKELKVPDGESQIEVNKRMTDGFWDVVNKNKGKNIAIISHGTAISFLLMNWCKLLDVKINLFRKIEFNGKIIINKVYNSPEVFKVTLSEKNEVLNIENLEFKELN